MATNEGESALDAANVDDLASLFKTHWMQQLRSQTGGWRRSWRTCEPNAFVSFIKELPPYIGKELRDLFVRVRFD